MDKISLYTSVLTLHWMIFDVQSILQKRILVIIQIVRGGNSDGSIDRIEEKSFWVCK
jgi:hypothetical protein